MRSSKMPRFQRAISSTCRLGAFPHALGEEIAADYEITAHQHDIAAALSMPMSHVGDNIADWLPLL